MLLKRNVLENVTIVSCSGTIICIVLNYISNISPITGIWFIICILFVFVLSLFGSFKFIQWLLSLNKPIKYDIAKLIENYPFMSLFSELLPKFETKIEYEPKEYDTNELSVITTVLEKKLVSSWYVPYISEEIGFPFASKQMLDQMIAKAFQICNKIDNKDVFVDMCAILTSHLKEYKKAVKRHETSPEESIEDLFKMTHPTSNSKNMNACVDHCTSIVRIILKELVPWELWDTPYSELLVRIMGKKLNSFIENTIANPVWLNDRLLMLLTKEKEPIDTITQNIEKEVPKETIVEHPNESMEEIKPKLANDVLKKSVVIQGLVEEKKENKKEVLEVLGTEPIEMKPVLRQRRGRQGRNEVKIYDRIIEGSVKTWETDMDLQCISVGQDLLASLDEMTLSRLWGQEDTEHSPNLRAPSPQPLWFGEEDTIELDLELGRECKKESSPKPAELLRDLQCSVHSAKARIGDLQVPYIDVTRKPYSDEAAGMMEGLLDKGIAGIKKGLRFTGLSDDSQEKQDKSPAHKASEVSPDRHKPRPEVMEAQEAYISMDTQKEDNESLCHPLVKQHKIISQDSMPPGRDRSPLAPSPSPPGSPEPQYEEAADLSASIAKLRSLLQHAPPRAEEVWWEGAEETRGRPARSFSKAPDPAALADEYDMNLERNPSPGQTGNNMQRLDKLFQRTVTGVFNSIKTAVGAEGEGPGDAAGARGELRDWTYVCTTTELGVSGAAARLAGSRRALWHVDAALDPLKHLRIPQQPQPLDLEEWLCACGSRWAAAGSLAGELGLCSSHLAFRLATVLFADVAESLICAWLDECTSWLKKQVFVYFEQLSETTDSEGETNLRDFDIEETCRIVGEYMPECVCCVRALWSPRRARDCSHRGLDALGARYHAAAMEHYTGP